MKEIEIHQRESEQDTESFLQENIGKFETNCLFLLKLMLRGERLSGKDVMMKYGIHDRRLRDLEISGKCEKRWVYKDNGKRSHVEYFITIPKPFTKSEVIERANKAIEKMKEAEKVLVKIFELPDDPPHYSQQTLFP